MDPWKKWTSWSLKLSWKLQVWRHVAERNTGRASQHGACWSLEVLELKHDQTEGNTGPCFEARAVSPKTPRKYARGVLKSDRACWAVTSKARAFNAWQRQKEGRLDRERSEGIEERPKIHEVWSLKRIKTQGFRDDFWTTTEIHRFSTVFLFLLCI